MSLTGCDSFNGSPQVKQDLLSTSKEEQGVNLFKNAKVQIDLNEVSKQSVRFAQLNKGLNLNNKAELLALGVATANSAGKTKSGHEIVMPAHIHI